MATPAFFNYEQYMTAKLAQVQNAEPAAGWTLTKLMESFAQNGFATAEGAYNHFVQFGAAEEVAPNASFNANEYYAAKAAQFYGVEPKAVTEFQIANIKQIITSNGMNAWTHYQQFGSNEGVNPSNAFDASAYLTAKAAAMAGEWTAAKVADAIKANGMTVLEHYLTYAGKGEGEVAEGATYPVSADHKVPSSNPGQTYNLTDKIDTFTGTAGDDKFVGSATTTQAADQIDGGAGDDTFTFIGANAVATGGTAPGNLVLPTMTNIENLVFSQNDSKTIDVSTITGLKTVTLDKHDLTNASEITLAGQAVTVKAPVLVAGDKLTFKGSDTALNLTVDGVKAATGVAAPTFDVAGDKMATVDLTALNNDSAFTLTDTGTALKTLNIKGDAKVDVATAVALTKIDASANSAGVKIAATGVADLTFTGTAKDDYLNLAGTLTAKDVINFGEGTADTLAVSTATLDKTQATIINKAAGLDILEVNGATGSVSIDADPFTVNTFKIAGVAITGTAGAATGQDGTVGVTFNGLASDGSDTILLAANVTGGAGGAAAGSSNANGGNGAAALSLGLKANSVADTATIKIVDADVALAGGALGAKDGTGSDGVKGVSIDAHFIETLNIEVAKNLTASDGTLVAASAKLNISGTGDVALGTVTDSKGVADADNHLTINAADLVGKLTLATGAGNDTITVGSKGSDITAGAGDDTITLGAGVDKVVLDDRTAGGIDTVNGFANGTDVLYFADSTANVAAKSAATFTKGEGTGQFADIDAVLATFATGKVNVAELGANGAVSFEFDGAVYVVIGDSNIGYSASQDAVVKLAGITLTTDGIDLNGAIA